MRTNQIFLGKRVILLHAVVLGLLVMMSIGACKTKKENGDDQKMAVTTDVSCLVLKSTQLDDWFPRYTKPSLPEDDKIVVIKFYVSQVVGSDAIKVTAQGYNRNDSPIGSTLTLADGLACGVNLPPYLVGQSYDVTLSDLNIINKTDGSLVANFDKIIMRPMVYQEPSIPFDFLRFQMDVYVGNAPVEERYLLPCPPCYNCRPVPDTCIKQDSTAITPVDTTGN